MSLLVLSVISATVFAVDVGIYNPQSNEFEVRLRPSQDLQGNITNIQFTIKWPENTTQLVTIQSEYQLEQQGPVYEDGGYNYAVFVSVAGSPIDWQADNEYVILSFASDANGESETCYTIADDEWADLNNGLYFFELADASYTGIIYRPFAGYCDAINIGLFNPQCSRFEVRLSPNRDFESNITNIQFTIKWPQNTVNILDIESDFKLEQQGPVYEHNGYNYAVFISVPELTGLPIDWQSGEEYVVMSFRHDQSGDGVTDFTFADDEWADINNGLFFVELWGSDFTGFVYHEALGSFIGACNFAYLRVFLQGAWDQSIQAMRTSLNASGYLPLAHPYGVEPWNYPGSESVMHFPDSIVDWVIVELRDPIDPAIIIETRAGLLTKHGLVLNTNFEDGILFDSAPGNYYLVVKHRNHIPVMSGLPVTFPNNLEPYNFTEIDDTQPHKHNDPLQTVLELEPFGSGKYGMIGGDVLSNEMLIYTGLNNDRLPIQTLIFAKTGSSSISTTTTGYYTEDTSMDGIVRYTGLENDRLIIQTNLFRLTGSSSISVIYESKVP